MTGYTPAQAAALTNLPLSAVHKAIDTRVIRPQSSRSGGSVRRLLSKEQLVFLELEAQGVKLLPRATRRQIADHIQQQPRSNGMQVGSALWVEIETARKRVDKQLKQLARLEEMIHSDPEIMGGTPVFRGTRIPVDLVSDMLAQGTTEEEILSGYPTLTKESLEVALLYMRAFPHRGRPPRQPWHGQKPRHIASYAIADLLKKRR